MSQFKVGQKVQIADGRQGIVRFIGEVSFKDGQWIGLELEEPEGKNDGSVRGERYFDCPPNHGLFIQPSPAIAVLAQPKPSAPKANGKPAPSTAGAARPRPSSTVSTPSTRDSRQSVSNTAAAAKRTSMAPPPPKPDLRRQSMAPTTTTATSRTSRPSIAGRAGGALSPKKPSVPPSRQSSVGRASLAGRTPGVKSPTPSAASPSSLLSPRTTSPGTKTTAAPAPTRPAPPSAGVGPSAAAPRALTTGANKAIQESEAKIRLLEKKVQEVRQKNTDLQAQADNAERYQGVVTKLQEKAKAQYTEINELKRQLKEAESGASKIEAIQAEHDTDLEMATLDREMAEEKAEVLKAELDSIKTKLQELELESEILKGENEELSKDMSPEERASQGWLQMQRENTRLREALLRLRDMTHEHEASLREEITILEEDSKELDAVKEEYDNTRTRLLEVEAETEDLREQLEAALGAETMIEQLTDKNLEMTTRIEELQNTVEDLESLKELNDQIELSHIEDNKQMQQDIDYKEALLIDSARRVMQLDEELADRDYTVQRFRELVTNMQSDLEDMRSSKEFTETQAQELGSHSRAMMDFNRKLQASASNTRIKTIEMEMRQMEAQESAEHLSIVQLFLPDAFQSERDSVLALLRFKRVAFKSQLLYSFMKERIATPKPHSHSDQLLAACDALDKLTWIHAMCDRFISCISASTLEQFAVFESVLYELEPVERTLNGFIDNLRKDELHDRQVADGLQRAIAVMQHLSELHLPHGIESFADRVLMKTMLMQSHLETTAAALQIIKTELLQALPTSEEGEDLMSLFVSKTDALAMQARQARVITGKVLRALQDFKARGLALTTESEPDFDFAQSMTEDLTASLRQLGLVINGQIHDGERQSPYSFADLMATMRQYNSSQDADVFVPLQVKMKALHERLSDVFSVSQDLSNTVEFDKPQPPWVLRSKALAESKLVSQDAQQEITSLKREIHERGTTIKMREQSLEEADVKIQILEARMKDSSKKVSRIEELENLITTAKKTERELEQKLDEKTALSGRLEEERDRWMRKAAELQAQDPSTTGDLKKTGVNLVGTTQEMEALGAEIKALQATLRYLRRELTRDKREVMQSQSSWLSQPLVPDRAMKGSNLGVLERRADAKEAFRALAELPANVLAAGSPSVIGGDRKERMKWKPRALTLQYKLYEAEMQWLDAKDLMSGECAGSTAAVASRHVLIV